ncbi:MAG: type II toxin-antitoxin system VapC family toxin [Thermoprotei archaeon]
MLWALRAMVDSNVFVYVLFSDPEYGERAKALLKEAEEKGGVTSTLAVSQVLAHLERRKRFEAIPVFLEYLNGSGIEVLETTWEDFLEGAKLIRERGLSYRLWDDAVIQAQMRRAKVEVVISNDADFDILGAKRVF